MTQLEIPHDVIFVTFIRDEDGPFVGGLYSVHVIVGALQEGTFTGGLYSAHVVVRATRGFHVIIVIRALL